MIEFMKWVMGSDLDRIYDGVEVDQRRSSGSRRPPPRSQSWCARASSHVDYLVMSTIFYNQRFIPPHVAAGINLSFWPMGTIFRACGASSSAARSRAIASTAR